MTASSNSTPDYLGMSLLDYYSAIYAKLRLRGRAHSTRHHYIAAFVKFGEHLGRTATMGDLTDENVTAGIAAILDDGLSPGTANSYRNSLLALWRFAARKGHLTIFPDVELVKEYRRTPTAWTPEQVGLIIQACSRVRSLRRQSYSGVPAPLFWQTLILLIYDTGLRIGAVMQLRCDDLDLVTRRVLARAETQKQMADQQVAISEQTCDLIRECLSYGKRELLFPWDKTPNYLHNRYTLIMKASGLPCGRRDKFHRLRRTTATLAELHVGPGTATRQLGHSSPEVTEGYIDRSFLPTSNVAEAIPRPVIERTIVGGERQLAVMVGEFLASGYFGGTTGDRRMERAATRLRSMFATTSITTVSAMSADVVWDYLVAKAANGMAPKTVSDYWQDIRSFLDWLVMVNGATAASSALLAVGKFDVSEITKAQPPALNADTTASVAIAAAETYPIKIRGARRAEKAEADAPPPTGLFGRALNAIFSKLLGGAE